MRTNGHDGHGNPFVPRRADGGEPLRCCLRYAEADERIALIGYAPPGTAAGYREVGPVFVHADACHGPRGTGYPTAYTDRDQVFRGYDADGAIADAILAGPGEHDIVIDKLFADERVVEIHTRNVTYGCFMLRIRRG
ncbi:MAG: DUF1203 domain-containing protein [Acidimicrobiales bacterium]